MFGVVRVFVLLGCECEEMGMVIRSRTALAPLNK